MSKTFGSINVGSADYTISPQPETVMHRISNTPHFEHGKLVDALLFRSLSASITRSMCARLSSRCRSKADVGYIKSTWINPRIVTIPDTGKVFIEGFAMHFLCDSLSRKVYMPAKKLSDKNDLPKLSPCIQSASVLNTNRLS